MTIVAAQQRHAAYHMSERSCERVERHLAHPARDRDTNVEQLDQRSDQDDRPARDAARAIRNERRATPRGTARAAYIRAKKTSPASASCDFESIAG